MSRVLHRLPPAERRQAVEAFVGLDVLVEVELVRGVKVTVHRGRVVAVARLLNGTADVVVLAMNTGTYATSLATVRSITPTERNAR